MLEAGGAGHCAPAVRLVVKAQKPASAVARFSARTILSFTPQRAGNSFHGQAYFKRWRATESCAAAVPSTLPGSNDSPAPASMQIPPFKMAVKKPDLRRKSGSLMNSRLSTVIHLGFVASSDCSPVGTGRGSDRCWTGWSPGDSFSAVWMRQSAQTWAANYYVGLL